MSSLRDQLLKKGMVSKKRARSVGRELKQERKQEQGKRKRKKHVQAKERAEREAAAEATRTERVEDRRRRDREKARTERALRVLHLLHGNRMKIDGTVRFHHPSVDGRYLLRMAVSERGAFGLRNGALGIGAIVRGTGHDYMVLPRAAVEQLKSLAPHTVVFHVTDTEGLSDPALRFAPTSADGDLRARRATPEDAPGRALVCDRGDRQLSEK
jgi:uncharacterized protein YaiL (DUF2058 family)